MNWAEFWIAILAAAVLIAIEVAVIWWRIAVGAKEIGLSWKRAYYAAVDEINAQEPHDVRPEGN